MRVSQSPGTGREENCVGRHNVEEQKRVAREWLESKNPIQRSIAVELFVDIDADGVTPLLFEKLGDEDEMVRAVAARELAKKMDEALFGELEQLFRTGNKVVREGVIDTFAEWGELLGRNSMKDKAIETLEEALEDTDEDVRLRAASSLGILGSSAGYEMALWTLVDCEEKTRGLAARALGAIGKKEAIPHLEICHEKSCRVWQKIRDLREFVKYDASPKGEESKQEHQLRHLNIEHELECTLWKVIEKLKGHGKG